MAILKTICKDLIQDGKTWILWSNPIKHTWYRIQWHLRPKTKKVGRQPLDVDVELANGCNFRCVMCQQSTNWLPKKDEKFMSWDTLRNVVSQSRALGVASMKVNWRGESTLDPECAEKIAYIKRQGIHEVQMNSNASKLTPALADSLIKSLDRIIFSCDGISKTTYNKIRKGGDFDRFIENVKMFRQRRNAKDKLLPFWSRRKGLPVIRINIAQMKQNESEKGKFREYFKDIADEIRINTVYQPQASKINDNQKRKIKQKGCPQIYQRLIVDVEGNVMPCCVDFREKLCFGNVKDLTLKEIWLNRAKYLRDAHESGYARQLEGCAECDNFSLLEFKDKQPVYR